MQSVFQKAERARQEAAWQRRLKRAEDARADAMKILLQDAGVPKVGHGMSTEQLKQLVEEQMKGGMPDPKELDQETQKKRKQLAAEKKKTKAAEEARIKRENEEQKKRIKNTKSRTDDDASDDATGRARAKAEREREARRKAEAAALKSENAEKRNRIRNTTAATDNKIWDDGDGSAGAARAVMAAESKARKEAEAVELAKENAEMREMIANTGAATDNDITDDATGAARRQAAQNASARKVCRSIPHPLPTPHLHP